MINLLVKITVTQCNRWSLSVVLVEEITITGLMTKES